jgi:hypothetical protein
MGSHPPTSFELSPTTHTAPIAGPSCNTPTTPSMLTRRYHEPTIDPELETPTKWMCVLYGTLATTSSGSLLVSKVWMTSAFSPITPVLKTLPELPVPDWSLLQHSKRYQSREALETCVDKFTQSLSDAHNIIQVQEVMDERKNAQLVLQHSHLGKLNQSLQTKENKTKDDHTKLFPKGHGQHLTAEEFCDELREQQREKGDKAKRKTNREARKVKKGAAKIQLERMLAEHKEAVTRWEGQCAILRAENVHVKDLPPKPKCPLKPKPASGGDGEPDKSSDSSDGDNES